MPQRLYLLTMHLLHLLPLLPMYLLKPVMEVVPIHLQRDYIGMQPLTLARIIVVGESAWKMQ
jgi:hypothetical protein